jgi:hypothetical protein
LSVIKRKFERRIVHACKCAVPSKSDCSVMIMRVPANIFHSIRKLKSFEDLPPSDDELGPSDSPHPLGRHTCAAYPQIPGSPSDIESMTQVDFCDGDQEGDVDYGDAFQPPNEDRYDEKGNNLQIPPPVTRSHTLAVDATILAGIQTLREVRVETNEWVSSLGPLESRPRVFQEHYRAACQGNAGCSMQEAVDTFLGSVERHVDTGRLILKRLRESPVISLPPSHETWGNFLGAGDIMETLYQRITLLEARLDIFAPHGPSLLKGESTIMKWRGLVDQF